MLKNFQPEIDFIKGGALVPSKELAYKTNSDGQVVEKVKPLVKEFEKSLNQEFAKLLENGKAFPTEEKVFLFITHGLNSQKVYKNFDLDNKAKTICDALKKAVYIDDSQIDVLLCNKSFLKNTSESFFRITVKILDEKTRFFLEKRMDSFRV
jgi:Holliday junction resolvase RusA-like endonuclease